MLQDQAREQPAALTIKIRSDKDIENASEIRWLAGLLRCRQAFIEVANASLVQTRGQPVEHRMNQIRLRAEIIADGRDIDLGAGGNVPEGRLLQAHLRKDKFCRVNNPLCNLLVPGLLLGGFRGHVLGSACTLRISCAPLF